MRHENKPEEIPQIEKTQTSNNFLMPASILIAGVLIAGAVVYSVGKKSDTKIPQAAGNTQTAAPSANLAEALKINGSDAVLGDVNAPVTFVEYGDYQCPFCGRFFSQVEPSLRADYIKTGKVKMVYRNFQFLGAESTNAGAAAECAKYQSKFWEYHDALYGAKVKDAANGENDGFFSRNEFLKLAGNVGLDMNAFTSCIDSNKYDDQVKKDTAAAQAIGVNSTPTSYVNGQMVQGAQPYSAFKAAIDAALATK
ncbi:MAG: DsbA family protein [Patescibacteria group bacterium]|nr:DsbA family protein [Patescibacteria group bacterium]MDE2015464.1 DsbA family protein [Patescibacteria group bacterium]MDE2226920.1 DsbA family protein [Patescibacteria group bacterium]